MNIDKLNNKYNLEPTLKTSSSKLYTYKLPTPEAKYEEKKSKPGNRWPCPNRATIQTVLEQLSGQSFNNYPDSRADQLRLSEKIGNILIWFGQLLPICQVSMYNGLFWSVKTSYLWLCGD